jgi:glycosyltransferase involved in cell wall biosynthesis
VNARQHESHQDLLTHIVAQDAPRAPLDAIIVPNGRPAAYLEQAIAAAKQLDAHLLLLCSMHANASSAALAAKREGVRVTAVNLDELPKQVVPEFATDTLLRPTRFHRPVDTSLKRNIGLLVGILAGWKRILFLDDDIRLPDPRDLTAAAGLLSGYPVVGLANAGMPDNSVVCHALRDVGADQDVFIGGGALAVGESAFSSFFPNIYNEDWFFLLDGLRLRPSAVTGTAFQYDYDPYNDPRRARGEELGDTLAEGVFGLLDNGLGLANADEPYWAEFLPERRRIISTTIERVVASDIEPGQRARMVAALKASIGRSHLITPELCVGYLRAWQNDCVRWRKHIRELRRDHRGGLGIDGALATLGSATSRRRSIPA